MDRPVTELTAEDVVEIVTLLGDSGIEPILDGGWAVDALLGRQTRPHADLDLAVEHEHVLDIRRLLGQRGFAEVPRDDSWACNFVLEDSRGRRVDVHSFTFDAAGGHVFGVAYPFDSLRGAGAVNGVPVRCIAPEWLVRFHSGYCLDENDYRDVMALCRHFALDLPAGFEGFRKTDPAALPDAD